MTKLNRASTRMRPRLSICATWVTIFVAATLMGGCSKKDNSISQAEKTGGAAPSIAETKAIAEEGFIYGLPL